MANRVKIDRELADLIPRFMANRDNDIDALAAALKNGDFEAIRVIGHTLKGIGGGYGFNKITDLGAAIEQAAKMRDTKRALELINELQSYIKTVEIIYD